MATQLKGYQPTLHCYRNDHYSQRIRLMMHAKNISFDCVEYDARHTPENLFKDNTSINQLPVLIDREISICYPEVLVEYLEERYPHPPLTKASPREKALYRLMCRRLDEEVSAIVDQLVKNTSRPNIIKQCREQLRAVITSLSPAFNDFPFYMSNSFSLYDCILLPILWRLPTLKIEPLDEKACSAIMQYQERMFANEVFQASLTDEERELRPEDYFPE